MEAQSHDRRDPRPRGKVAVITGHEGQFGTGRAAAVCPVQGGGRIVVADTFC